MGQISADRTINLAEGDLGSHHRLRIAMDARRYRVASRAMVTSMPAGTAATHTMTVRMPPDVATADALAPTVAVNIRRAIRKHARGSSAGAKLSAACGFRACARRTMNPVAANHRRAAW